MGIEYLLIRDDTREIYDLGKGTGNWARLLCGAGYDDDRADLGHPFQVDRDVERVVARLEADWHGVVTTTPGYLRRVAEDILRWAGDAVVRFSSDGSHDGWRNRDGSWDEGRQTGSRYAEDHPEWPRSPGGAVEP